MIWVRLIGGLHDGEVAKVDPDQVEIVKSRALPGPATRAVNRTFGLAQSEARIAATHYTRRVVRIPAGEVVYFAEAALSDLESLQHVLGP